MTPNRLSWRKPWPAALLLAALFPFAGSVELAPQDPASQPATDKLSLAHISWLSGHWRSESSRGMTEELWMPARGRIMLGLNRSVRGKAHGQFEYLRIVQTKKDTYYWASPGGSKPTPFKMTKATDDHVVFENPERKPAPGGSGRTPNADHLSSTSPCRPPICADVLQHRAGHREHGRQCPRQTLPVVAAVRAGVHLPVARPDINALGLEAIGVHSLAVDALVVVRAGQALGQRLPRGSRIARAVDGELPRTCAEVVAPDLERNDVRRVWLSARHRDREAVERG